MSKIENISRIKSLEALKEYIVLYILGFTYFAFTFFSTAVKMKPRAVRVDDLVM